MERAAKNMHLCRTNTANRAPTMPMHHSYVSIPVCTISILWNFHTNPYHPSKNYELKQQGDGAGETSRTTNYELQGKGWATRAPVAQTLQTVRQACPCTTASWPYTFARLYSFHHVELCAARCFRRIQDTRAHTPG